MARSMWNGAISIHGVDIPCKVFAATESHTPSFRELHEKDGAPVEHKRVSAKSGREIDYKRIVKGYETSSGRFVVLTDDEIKAVEQPERRAIEIEASVPAEQVDPIHYDRAYHLGAGKDGREAFAALLRALDRTGLVGIGRVVLRTKEQLVAIRAGDKVIRMSTMRFADELIPADKLDIDSPRKKPSKAEIAMAGQLIEGLHASFDATKFHDTYRERVEEYARAKAKGSEPELPEAPEPEETPDLLEALRASVERRTHPPRRRRSSGGKARTTKKARR